jgi:shikimate kinase
MRIFLIGFMGSGKSHWGTQLAEQLKTPFIDLDEQIVKLEGKSIADVFAEKGEEFFRVREKELLEEMIDKNPSMVISVGGGTPCFFNNIDLMKRKGCVVWLNTDVDVLLKRLIREKEKRPLIKDIPDADLRTYIIRKLNERRLYYDQAQVRIDNESDMTPSKFIQSILHA